MTKRITILALWMVVLTLSVQGWSQAKNGKFSGAVYDPAGKKLRNATLILVNQHSATRYMTTTNTSGTFEFPALPAGEYTVKVCIAGLATLETRSTIEASRRTEEQFRMQARSATSTLPASSAAAAPHNIEAAQIVHMVQPIYPESARRRYAQGTVVFEGIIGTDGSVASLCIQNPEIDPDLAKAAVDAVTQWRYKPTLVDGMSVEVTTPLAVNFAFR